MGRLSRSEKNRDAGAERQPLTVTRDFRKRLQRLERLRATYPPEYVRPGDTYSVHLDDATSITMMTTDPYTKDGHIHFKISPLEDLMLHHRTPFKPPLVEYKKGPGEGFGFTWLKLHFAFNLPDPNRFPAVAGISVEDAEQLRFYIDTCKRLAGFYAISHTSNFLVGHQPFVGTTTRRIQATSFEATLPAEDQMIGASTTFRQLHLRGKSDDMNSFLKAFDNLWKYLEQRPELQAEARQWKNARKELTNRSLQTILFDMTVPPWAAGRPRNFGNIRPESLMEIFNYGDFIHLGRRRAEYDTLVRTDALRDFHLYALQASIGALAHLYFGFAVLCERALGEA